MSLSVHIGNQRKGFLIHGELPAKRLDDSTLKADERYRINFTQLNKRFVLSLYYNRSSRSLFVNATKIYQFKAENSEIKDYALCLVNI